MSGILRCIFVFAVSPAYPLLFWVSGASFLFYVRLLHSTEQNPPTHTHLSILRYSLRQLIFQLGSREPHKEAPLPYNACYCCCFIAYYFHRFSNISVTSRRLSMLAPFRADYVGSYPYRYNTAFAFYTLFYPQLLPPVTLGLPTPSYLS
jgi:hypothetical protein